MGRSKTADRLRKRTIFNDKILISLEAYMHTMGLATDFVRDHTPNDSHILRSFRDDCEEDYMASNEDKGIKRKPLTKRIKHILHAKLLIRADKI